MPVTPDIVVAKSPAETSVTRPRATLSVRAGTVSRLGVAATAGRVSVDRGSAGSRAPGLENGAVPLKRLTAGRKEISITHDGATYLLRITKSNKLILTKSAALEVAPTT